MRGRRAAALPLGLLLVVALGGGCARDAPRAAGIVERWLQAVSDQGRPGLLDDGRERAAEHGDPGAAAGVVPPSPEEDERHFSDLEVGRAEEGPLGARVPFRVTRRLEGGDTDEFRGTAVLARSGDGWRITAVDPPAPSERVPSDGGELPARAEPAQWMIALALGVAITAASVALIEAQPKPDARPNNELA